MSRVLSSFVLLFLVSLAPLTRADSYSDALQTFRQAGESAGFFNNAYGYAIFPTIGKGGIGIGGAHGRGRVYVGGQHVGDSSMTQVTLGFQLGGQAFSQIIFFENEAAFREFTSGNFEFSAQATAVVITAGASAEANTGGGLSAGASGGRNDATNAHAGYRKGMAIFTIAKGGLMYEAVLGGQKFSYNRV
jgi:hypothetical protein